MAISTILTLLPLLFSSALVNAQACPALPSPLPAPTDLPIISAFPDPFTFFNNASVQSPDDWACRKAELKTLVQEYMYGYYPDHSLENVTARRSGNSITITVSAGGKSSSFGATLSLPTSTRATAQNPAPVVISAGGVNNTVFLGSGIALASFNLPDVAADSVNPGGAFWNLYSGRDIGESFPWHRSASTSDHPLKAS